MTYEDLYGSGYECEECGEEFDSAVEFFDHLGHGNVCPVVIS